MKLFQSWRETVTGLFSVQKRKFRKLNKQHRLDQKLVGSLNKARFPAFNQIRRFFLILDRTERRRVYAALWLMAVLLIVLAGRFYYRATLSVPQTGGEYTEGLIGSPRFINPILAQTNDVDLDLSQLIFSGLFKRDQNRQLQPDLVESYEVSSDQLVYTFRLKDNVRWHDGESLKADDVVFTVAAIQDLEYKSPLNRSFRGIVAEKVDEQTVKFVLKEPYAPFLGLLTFGILPEHLWYSISPTTADLAELNKRPIGTGAWQFDHFKKDKNGNIKSYVLKVNKDYYGPRPYLEKLIFKFYGDFISAVEALKNKEVRGLSYLPKEYKGELIKHKNIVYHDLDQPQYTAIFFNQKKNNLLKADYIRQVLALSTDKRRIIGEAFGGEGRAINEPTLPGIESNPDIKKYEYQPEKAAELLEKNGWQLVNTTTADGLAVQIRVKKSIPLKIALTTVDQPENVAIAEIIQKLWGEIGVQTVLNIIGKEKIIQDVIKTREYEALIFGENLGFDPDPFPFWHSSQSEYPGLNLASFAHKTADQLLEEARKTNLWEDRKKKYLAFQKIVAEALPAIFLHNPTYTYPQDKKIGGFQTFGIAVAADRFANLSEWYVKTKRIWR